MGIKTRVWDSKLKVMITNENMSEIIESKHIKDDSYYYYGDEFYPYYGIYNLVFNTEEEEDDRMKVMLCMEFKDKNGKEIYDGDIIEKTYYSYHQPECSELFEIKYEGLGFHFEHIKGNTFYLPFTEDIEVIGNIYENPELLK